MRHHSIKLKREVTLLPRGQISVVTLVLMLLFLCPAASAQSPQPDKAKSEIADYVRGRYKVRHLHSKMEKTEHGPSGTIYVIEDLTPRNLGAAMARPEKADRARGIAEALILSEPDIFGIVKQDELRYEASGSMHFRVR